VQISNAVKVFLAFDAPFWPEGLFDVVCTDCFLPELWILSYPPGGGGEGVRDPSGGKERVRGGGGGGGGGGVWFDPSVAKRTKEVVTFFACGNLADQLSTMPAQEVVDKALDQLDEMFGTEARCGEGNRKNTVVQCC